MLVGLIRSVFHALPVQTVCFCFPLASLSLIDSLAFSLTCSRFFLPVFRLLQRIRNFLHGGFCRFYKFFFQCSQTLYRIIPQFFCHRYAPALAAIWNNHQGFLYPLSVFPAGQYLATTSQAFSYACSATSSTSVSTSAKFHCDIFKHRMFFSKLRHFSPQ